MVVHGPALAAVPGEPWRGLRELRRGAGGGLPGRRVAGGRVRVPGGLATKRKFTIQSIDCEASGHHVSL